MSGDFSQVSILGAGLLGGSLALALRSLEQPPAVRLWARKPEAMAEARKIGLEDTLTCDLSEAVNGADLVILCVPVGAMPALVNATIQAGLPSTSLITDVGSVKRAPHETIPPLLAKHGASFLGSHPMAGSERTGLAAASVDLFQNAACLLTNDGHVAGSKAAALERFWQSVGCRTSWMSAAIHDELVARISHLPHIIAASGARICLQDLAEGRFGGGGLRDTTRVASGNPEMWAEILIENRRALAGPLRETIADLSEILALLENGEQELACRWLTTAKERRDSLTQTR